VSAGDVWWYPKELDARVAVRAELREQVLAAAERSVRLAGRSMVCGEYDNHAPGGCQNDGSTCICECHDPADT
jgi:hypothetical protein